MKHVTHWIVAMMTAFLSCLAPDVRSATNASQPETLVLSMSELWKERAQLDGQVVRVTGFYHGKPPTSALYPDQDSFERKDGSLLLWIGSDKPRSKAESTARKDRGWVIIEGTFRNEGAGIFDQFFAQLENITEIQSLPGKPPQPK